MNHLVTGGCGFIGANLVRELRRRDGCGVRVVDDLSEGTREALAAVGEVAEIGPAQIEGPPAGSAVELVVGDVRDAGLTARSARGVDTIVHLAASTGVGPSVEDPRRDCDVNVVGTLNMLEAARATGVRRFVFASSGAPVGECTPPIHEELAPHPVSPYGASKLAGEGYCSAYFRSFGVETVALRFGNVYGPGSSRKQSVVAKFIRQAMAGETLEIYGDGNQTRDFLFIDDLVGAVLKAAVTPDVGGETFQIATSRETTVLELVETLLPALEAAGVPKPRVRHGERRVGDVLRNYSDTSKALERLGWRAEVPLAVGLTQTVKWFVGNRGVGG